MAQIEIINASNVLTDAEVRAVIPALQEWDDTLLAPAYALERCVYSFASRRGAKTMPQYEAAGIWPILLNRHSTDPGALGWHDDQAGLIYGRVFVGDCKRYGVSWTVDLSHEAAETRCDPTINDLVPLPDGTQTIREVCDAVEDDSLGISVGGVLLSDFVLPSYWSQGPGPWDQQNVLKGPAPALAIGGYLSILKDGQWTQITQMHLGGASSYRAQRVHHSHRRPR